MRPIPPRPTYGLFLLACCLASTANFAHAQRGPIAATNTLIYLQTVFPHIYGENGLVENAAETINILAGPDYMDWPPASDSGLVGDSPRPDFSFGIMKYIEERVPNKTRYDFPPSSPGKLVFIDEHLKHGSRVHLEASMGVASTFDRQALTITGFEFGDTTLEGEITYTRIATNPNFPGEGMPIEGTSGIDEFLFDDGTSSGSSGLWILDLLELGDDGLPLYLGGDLIALTPIPEPSTYALLLCGALLLMARARCRGGRR